MKIFVALFLIFSFSTVFSKVFKTCEFVKELHKKHNIPQKDINMHLCRAGSNLDTTNSTKTKNGIYGMVSHWDCGYKTASGRCNIKCSNLRDDDITDDVKCIQKIFNYLGRFAQPKYRGRCHYNNRTVNNCFKNM